MRHESGWDAHTAQGSFGTAAVLLSHVCPHACPLPMAGMVRDRLGTRGLSPGWPQVQGLPRASSAAQGQGANPAAGDVSDALLITNDPFSSP